MKGDKMQDIITSPDREEIATPADRRDLWELAGGQPLLRVVDRVLCSLDEG